jgi:type II secretory pathway component PulF
MLNAGLSLSLALKTLSTETRNKAMKRALASIEHVIDNGRQLSDGLAEHPEVFPPLFIAVIRVGEAGGTLSEVLARLADIAKKEKALRTKVISALIYPAIVVVAMIVIIVILMLYVFPQLIGIFNEVGADLPVQTKVLIAVVNFMQAYGLYVAGGSIVMLLLLLMGRKIRSVHKLYHAVMLRIPFVGKVAQELALTRVLSNIKMLMVSGVPIVQAFTIGSKTAGNLVYEDALVQISKKLELGNALHAVLAQQPRLFPSLAVTMAKVGEETGKLDEIMGKLHTFYQDRVDTIFSNLSTIIEPFLLLSIGVMVGFIAVSVIMPIYNLAQAF